MKKRKIHTSINDHPFNLEFFPSELHSVMGINKSKNKRINISGLVSKDVLNFDALLEDKNEEKDEEKDEEDVEEEEDDIDEDEDDDYNAERYFDDGGSDDDDGDFDEAAF